MREKRRMLAKVPGGPRSQATNPTEPISKARTRVPGLCSILEETSTSLCLLRRSNILCLESTALPPSCCTCLHTIVQIPISSWFLFSIFTFALDLCWYLCHHRFETPSSVRQVLGNHWCCSKAQKQMLLMPSPELLGGESEIYLKVWGTRLFQRKNPKQQILQLRDPGEHLILAEGEVANGGCDTWLKEKVHFFLQSRITASICNLPLCEYEVLTWVS